MDSARFLHDGAPSSSPAPQTPPPGDRPPSSHPGRPLLLPMPHRQRSDGDGLTSHSQTYTNDGHLSLAESALAFGVDPQALHVDRTSESGVKRKSRDSIHEPTAPLAAAAPLLTSPSALQPFSQKKVKLTFTCEHKLSAASGVLIYVTPDVWATEFLPRFIDVSPTEASFTQAEEPFILLNEVFGKTWMDATSAAHMPGGLAETMCQLRNQQEFITFVDDESAWRDAEDLGFCSNNGTLASNPSTNSSAFILALSPQQPAFTDPLTLPPLPIAPSILTLITELQNHFTTNAKAALNKHKNAINRLWFRENYNWLLAYNNLKTSLDPGHPLYALRGNTAVFDYKIWKSMCYGANAKIDEMADMPDPYCQAVFEDLQLRERREGPDGESRLAEMEDGVYDEVMREVRQQVDDERAGEKGGD